MSVLLRSNRRGAAEMGVAVEEGRALLANHLERFAAEGIEFALSHNVEGLGIQVAFVHENLARSKLLLPGNHGELLHAVWGQSRNRRQVPVRHEHLLDKLDVCRVFQPHAERLAGLFVLFQGLHLHDLEVCGANAPSRARLYGCRRDESRLVVHHRRVSEAMASAYCLLLEENALFARRPLRAHEKEGVILRNNHESGRRGDVYNSAAQNVKDLVAEVPLHHEVLTRLEGLLPSGIYKLIDVTVTEGSQLVQSRIGAQHFFDHLHLFGVLGCRTPRPH
mmetsp:Transcript_14603/g.31938  ORF Transcript_14603/g.31938 Transcript_14603/m.31938 type:complete len:278 (-) Transcript_14603:200-1033(-)